MADFRLAQEVEYRINEQFSLDTQYGSRVPAKARDQVAGSPVTRKIRPPRSGSLAPSACLERS